MREPQFIEALQKGDTEAFEYLYELYYKPLCFFIRKLLRNYNEPPHDIATDAFLAVWKNRTNFPSLLQTRSYLFVAAQNKCKVFMKNEERKRLWVTGYGLITERYNNPCDTTFDKQKALNDVDKGLECLNPQDRKVLELHYNCEMKLVTVAQMLNLNTALVKKCKSRAIQKLRKRINCDGVNEVI